MIAKAFEGKSLMKNKIVPPLSLDSIYLCMF